MQHTFPKSERLNSKKFIDALFTKGASFTHYPFKVIYLPISRDQACEAVGEKIAGSKPPPAAQLVFSCSKRNFKKAVDRNQVKRRMREAWRLNKHKLPPDFYFLIAYIYIAREILPYQLVEEKLKSSIKRLGSINNSETSR